MKNVTLIALLSAGSTSTSHTTDKEDAMRAYFENTISSWISGSSLLTTERSQTQTSAACIRRPTLTGGRYPESGLIIAAIPNRTNPGT